MKLKLLIWLLPAVVVLFIGSVITLIIVFNPFVINTIVEEVYSPDYRYKVIIFEGNSGATSDFITHVSIMEANSRLKNSPGNIFRADANHLKARGGMGRTGSKSSMGRGTGSITALSSKSPDF